MLILPYDTETTGIPDWKMPSESPQQPHLIELAALLIDPLTLSVRDAFDCLIRPDGWTWDATSEAFQKHGITFEEAMDEGIAEADALEQFLAIHAKCDLRVAHNEMFDARLIRIALKRYGMNGAAFASSITQEAKDQAAEDFKAAPSYNTCQEARKFTQLPKNKVPKLDEAHRHFFGRPHEGSHRAMADAEACARVYFAITNPGRLLPDRLWPPLVNAQDTVHIAGAGAVLVDATTDRIED